MSRIKDYAETCNYNPLAMLSPATGVLATQPIDGILDHDSINDIYKVASIPLMPPAVLLMGIEIGIDYIFRRDIGIRKFKNMVDLAKNNNSQKPSRNNDLLFSVEAEAAARCEYGADIVHLYSVNRTVKHDFRDRHRDGEENFFNMDYERAHRIFKELCIREKVERIQSAPLEDLAKSAPYRYFGLTDPIKTYEDLRATLSD